MLCACFLVTHVTETWILQQCISINLPSGLGDNEEGHCQCWSAVATVNIMVVAVQLCITNLGVVTLLSCSRLLPVHVIHVLLDPHVFVFFKYGT